MTWSRQARAKARTEPLSGVVSGQECGRPFTVNVTSPAAASAGNNSTASQASERTTMFLPLLAALVR